MQPFDYYQAQSIEEASRLLIQYNGKAKIVAGATDLLIRIERGFLAPAVLIDVKKIPGFREIASGGSGGLRIGAAATMNQVVVDPLVVERYPLLADACRSVASYQLRNRATMGGNLCNGSPAADSAPALICYGASIELFGPAGTREMPLEAFFLGPGATALQAGELLTAILLPPPPTGAVGCWHKLGRTTVGDISVMNVAVLGWPDGDANSGASWRITLGSVAPTPLRATEAENLLARDSSSEGVAAAARAAAEASKPIDDIRASAVYRRDMVRVLTRRSVEKILNVTMS
ncbi:MAG: xanthine dehydrogenase family protein subunit M [Chloroflexota bacterium]|nr:xanthine dehydrogenase family protein subunit M [Chloroflexota bacterium]